MNPSATSDSIDYEVFRSEIENPFPGETEKDYIKRQQAVSVVLGKYLEMRILHPENDHDILVSRLARENKNLSSNYVTQILNNLKLKNLNLNNIPRWFINQAQEGIKEAMHNQHQWIEDDKNTAMHFKNLSEADALTIAKQRNEPWYKQIENLNTQITDPNQLTAGRLRVTYTTLVERQMAQETTSKQSQKANASTQESTVHSTLSSSSLSKRRQLSSAGKSHSSKKTNTSKGTSKKHIPRPNQQQRAQLYPYYYELENTKSNRPSAGERDLHDRYLALTAKETAERQQAEKQERRESIKRSYEHPSKYVDSSYRRYLQEKPKPQSRPQSARNSLQTRQGSKNTNNYIS